MNGKLIAIDGTEGSGKSTQIAKIADYLRAAGKSVYLTREPGGTPASERIRDLVLNPGFSLDGHCELLLILAARRQHLVEEIWPRLAQGQWVISDRFNDATYAYQGAGRAIPAQTIAQLEHWTQGDFQPDLSLIFTLPAAIADERLNRRGQQKDRMEQEDHLFFQRVAQEYRQRAQQPHAREIDASGDKEATFAQIQSHLATLLAS